MHANTWLLKPEVSLVHLNINLHPCMHCHLIERLPNTGSVSEHCAYSTQMPQFVVGVSLELLQLRSLLKPHGHKTTDSPVR